MNKTRRNRARKRREGRRLYRVAIAIGRAIGKRLTRERAEFLLSVQR